MENVFAGKKIVVCVTGSIAAFKVAGWVSNLAKLEANVSVIMTDSAQEFITPLTFSTLTGQKVYTSMFGDVLDQPLAHIELAQEADLFLIAPATATTIARLSHGLADDLLSATILATQSPVIVCPAMNSKMYLHEATQANLTSLKQYGYEVVDPEHGTMACKDIGPGRLVTWEIISEILIRKLGKSDFAGKKILVTAGPTREPIDPARFISNRSSGKMGYAVATAASRRGGEVTLVSGPSTLPCPYGVKRIMVTNAREMYEVVVKEFAQSDIAVKSAAVSDFRPSVEEAHKVKKDHADLEIALTVNPDILLELGKIKREKEQVLVGFAAESRNLVEEARKKLNKKNLDLICVNDISSDTAGFEVETNKLILVDSEKEKTLPQTTKLLSAHLLLDAINEI